MAKRPAGIAPFDTIGRWGVPEDHAKLQPDTMARPYDGKRQLGYPLVDDVSCDAS